MSPTRKPASHLPLKPVVYLMLASLADGEAHGYRIRKEIARRSRGVVQLDPGTLYRHIGRLIEDGLLAETDLHRDSDLDDTRRRYYQLTTLGEEVLAGEARRMADLVDDARARKLIEDQSPA